MIKKFYIWSLIIILWGMVTMKCIAGTMSSYPQTKTLQNADRIPAIIASGLSNANINWSDLKNIMSTGLNWTDIKAIGTQYGDHSGINWQAFGA